MVTNSKVNSLYMPELDGLRFFAFLLVFIHHTALFSIIPGLSILHKSGWIGVDLFFTLSAFLFTRLLIEEHRKTGKINLKKFYIRRIFRIWPIYFIFIIISVLIFAMVNDTGLSGYPGIRFAGLCSFSDNILTSIYGEYNPLPYTSHLWTISFEEQFYIFIPLILIFLIRSQRRIKIRAVVISVIVFELIRILFIFADTNYLTIWVLPLTHFESIVLGCVLGFRAIPAFIKKLNPVLIFICGLLLFIVMSLLPELNENTKTLLFIFTIAGLISALLLYSVLNSKFLRMLLTAKVIVFLGKRSYGLYVYHLACIGFVGYMEQKWPSLNLGYASQFFVALGLTIFISIASYAIIERPFLKWKATFEIVPSRPA